MGPVSGKGGITGLQEQTWPTNSQGRVGYFPTQHLASQLSRPNTGKGGSPRSPGAHKHQVGGPPPFNLTEDPSMLSSTNRELCFCTKLGKMPRTSGRVLPKTHAPHVNVWPQSPLRQSCRQISCFPLSRAFLPVVSQSPMPTGAGPLEQI